MKILLILLLTILPAISSAELAEESIVIGTTYTKNDRDNDNHMYYDGTYLWFVSTEYEYPSTYEASGQALIKFNPVTRSYTAYELAPPSGNQLVYQVIGSPSNSNILYIYGSYGSPLAIWVFNISGESSTGYTLTGWTAGGGGKIAAAYNGTNDILWITNGSNRKIGRMVVDAAPAVDDVDTVASGASNGSYGVAVTPTSTTNKQNIFVCTWDGVLYIVSSDFAGTLTDSSVTENFRTLLSLPTLQLFDAYYDGEYVWISAMSTNTAAGVVTLIKYKPSRSLAVAGTNTGKGSYEVFYSTQTVQTPVSVSSRGRYVYMSGEIYCTQLGTSCTVQRYLVGFDKITESFSYLPVDDFSTYQREFTSVETLNNGEVWLGGYGKNAVDGSDTWRVTRIHETGAWMR
jgi:hypothetical protein